MVARAFSAPPRFQEGSNARESQPI
jgi:hypothetical protein